MRAVRPGRAARQTSLERYSERLGHLVERRTAMLALDAARREAEEQARQARLAAAEASASNEALHREIERRVQTQSRLAHLASHAPLTGLPNRTLLAERLSHEIEAARQSGRGLALLYLDLDHFKDVNDTLGHAAGDDLLRVVARRLMGCLRNDAPPPRGAGPVPSEESLSLVARMGGDEFALWVADLDARGAAALAQRIIAAMSDPVAIAGPRVFVGVSIGVTLCPDDGDQVEALLRNGDIAMYRAKQEGRNRFQMFDTGLNQEVRRRASLEQALHEAVPLKQVAVAYQPQVEIATGRIVGVEALLRWTHPGHGAVSPDEFVPIAERCGLISGLGAWVLRESCRQAVAWAEAGLAPVRVAVNLAAAQFRNSDVPRLVADTLAETGLPPSRLELEVTETGVMHDMRDAAEVLRALAALGVTLAIDDFGTGYSSLSYLRKLPVDKIKIDRSFVSDVVTSEDAASVATAIVRRAHGLRLSVIAEGVETEAHARFIQETGCTLAQGHYYGRPMSPDDLARTLSRQGSQDAAPGQRPAPFLSHTGVDDGA